MPEPEQLGFEGMPRRLFAATPSRLGTFTACPRRYRFTYLVRPTPPKGPPWAHNSVGAAVHNALRDWWLLPLVAAHAGRGGRGCSTAAWISDGFADAAQSATWRARAREWVETYVATLDPADEPVGVERGVAVRTDRLALSGRVDRIDVRDGELVIVDYKTGRWVPDTDDARGSLALAVYALAAGRTLRRPCRRVELHHLPTGRVAGWEHTEESLARHVGRASDTADDIEQAAAAVAAGADVDAAYPPVTGPAVRVVRLPPALPGRPGRVDRAGTVVRARRAGHRPVRRRARRGLTTPRTDHARGPPLDRSGAVGWDGGVEIAEALDFLRQHHHGVLAVTRSDGRPQMSPVDATVDESGLVVISSRETAYKVRSLRARPYAAFCGFTDRFFGGVGAGRGAGADRLAAGGDGAAGRLLPLDRPASTRTGTTTGPRWSATSGSSSRSPRSGSAPPCRARSRLTTPRDRR